eukprot:s1957_g18.t1
MAGTKAKAAEEQLVPASELLRFLATAGLLASALARTTSEKVVRMLAEADAGKAKIPAWVIARCIAGLAIAVPAEPVIAALKALAAAAAARVVELFPEERALIFWSLSLHGCYEAIFDSMLEQTPWTVWAAKPKEEFLVSENGIIPSGKLMALCQVHLADLALQLEGRNRKGLSQAQRQHVLEAATLMQRTLSKESFAEADAISQALASMDLVASVGHSSPEGCSSLEVAQAGFKRTWQLPGLRSIAEEAALNCARYIRALGNLDGTLASSHSGSQGLVAVAKHRPERPRSRTPRRDDRPPLRRAAPSRDPPQRYREERYREDERRDRDRERDRDRRRERRTEEQPPPVSEHETEEESEEEEPQERDTEVKEEDKEDRHRDRREPPPEPARPPSWKSSEKDSSKKKKKKKKGKRGGAKHQRHRREEADPLRSSHRRLPPEKLELASSLQAGLERRA